MKLAFIIRDLGHGGAQRQLSILTAGLVREGHEVSVLHFYGGPFEPSFREAGVKTICIGKKSRWDLLGFFFRLIKAARSVQPEVLHGYLAESNLMALFLKPFCGFPRVAWGVRDSQTDAHLWGTLGKLSFRLNCLLARFADVIICNSKAGRDYYLARSYPAHKTHVVPNGIDTERFQPLARSAQCSVPSAQTSELSTEHCLLSTSAANTRNSEGTTFGLVGRLFGIGRRLFAALLLPLLL